MKIGILHLSDLHIENESCLTKIDNIVNACSFDVRQISNLFIVISGDIAKTGKRRTNLILLGVFITNLKEKIKP